MPKDSRRFSPSILGHGHDPELVHAPFLTKEDRVFRHKALKLAAADNIAALPKSHRGPIIQGCKVHDEGRWYRRNNEISNSEGNPPRSLALGIRCYFRVSREVTRAFSRFRRKAKLNKGSVECRQSKSRTIDGSARISSKPTARERTVTSAPK